MTTKDLDALRRLLRDLRQRMRLRRAWDGFLTSSFLLVSGLSVFFLFERILLEQGLWGGRTRGGDDVAMALLGAALASAVWSLWRLRGFSPPDLSLAVWLDWKSGSGDCLSAGLEAAGHSATAVGAALARKALEEAGRLELSCLLRPVRIGYRWSTLLNLSALVWLAALPPVAGGVRRSYELPEFGLSRPEPVSSLLPPDPLSSAAAKSPSENRSPGGGQAARPAGTARTGAPSFASAQDKPAESPSPQPSTGPTLRPQAPQAGNDPGGNFLGDPQRSLHQRVPRRVTPLFGDGQSKRGFGWKASGPAGDVDVEGQREQVRHHAEAARRVASHPSVAADDRILVRRYFEQWESR